MTAASWAFLTLGITIGIAVALLVWWVDDWATRRHHEALSEALNGGADVNQDSTIADTVAQAEAYLADMPYDHEREGL